MAANLVQGIDRIPGQIGYLVVSSDGAVLSSGGDLENEENVATIIVKMLEYASKIPLSTDDSQNFKRLSVVYDDFTLLATVSSQKVYIVKRANGLVHHSSTPVAQQEYNHFIMPRNGPYSSNQYLSHSKLQSPLTIKWLNEHYEVAQGVSLPRSSLYAHYLDFCQTSAINPVNAASFGKIIRHNFPNLKTRRLGTRGQSKYHYYGITIKETSPYFDTLLNTVRQPAQSNATTKTVESSVRNQTYHSSPKGSQHHCLMSSSGGTLLPLFPKSDSLDLPPTVSQEKVRTFLIMYRAHCQRILDTILRANFGEVQKFLVHFWQGMPGHILTILNCPEVIDLVGVCDNILFKAIGSVLIPGVLQPLPASLTQAIRQFATQLSSWLESSLNLFPEKLKEKKLEVARSFSKSLRRKTSLTHLAQAARTVLHSTEPVAQMISDWQEIDFSEIIKQTLWTFSSNPEKDSKTIESFLRDFSEHLEQQATIDQYAAWASNLVDTCVEKRIDEDDTESHERSRQFLLKWSFFGNQVMRELTLKSAQSFGSFHLLHILLEDYIVYYVECKAFLKTKEEGLDNDKVTNSEQCDPVVDEDVEIQDEIVEESTFPSEINTSNRACTSNRRKRNLSAGSEYQSNSTPLASESVSVSLPPGADYQTYPYFRTGEPRMHNYLTSHGYNSSQPYGVYSGQNIMYGGVYSPISDVRSPKDVKNYDHYNVQDNSPYTSRYLPQSTGNSLYVRNYYPANNGQYRDNHNQVACDHRLHSRLLGETY